MERKLKSVIPAKALSGFIYDKSRGGLIGPMSIVLDCLFNSGLTILVISIDYEQSILSSMGRVLNCVELLGLTHKIDFTFSREKGLVKIGSSVIVFASKFKDEPLKKGLGEIKADRVLIENGRKFPVTDVRHARTRTKSMNYRKTPAFMISESFLTEGFEDWAKLVSGVSVL